MPCYSFTARSAAGGFQQEQRSKSSEVPSKGYYPTRPSEIASPTQLFQISACQPKEGQLVPQAQPSLFFAMQPIIFCVPPKSQTAPSTLKYKGPPPPGSCDVTKSVSLLNNHRAWSFAACGKLGSAKANIQKSGF